jgi:hypothetical protein
LQVGRALRAAQRHHEGGEFGARADRDALCLRLRGALAPGHGVAGVGAVAEVVVGPLLQPRQPGVDLRGARGEGGAGIGVSHRGLRVDRDAVIHALFRPEAKRPAMRIFELCSDYSACVL